MVVFDYVKSEFCFKNSISNLVIIVIVSNRFTHKPPRDDLLAVSLSVDDLEQRGPLLPAPRRPPQVPPRVDPLHHGASVFVF